MFANLFVIVYGRLFRAIARFTRPLSIILKDPYVRKCFLGNYLSYRFMVDLWFTLRIVPSSSLGSSPSLFFFFCIPRHRLYLLNARFMSRICELVEHEIYSLETGETDESRSWQISGTSPLFPTRRVPWYVNTKIPIELCNHIYANQPQ